jgi:hypothetical protein
MKGSRHTFRMVAGLMGVILFLSMVVPLAAGDDAAAPQNASPKPEPGSVEDSFAYMAELATAAAQTVPLDMGRLAPILAYLLEHPDSGPSLHPLPPMDGMPGAYHSFSVERPLAEILAYAYNPDIPQVAFRPTSIRLSYWTEINGQREGALPRLWPLLARLEAPHQLRGKEVTEITPDLFSGAYFQYRLDTRLILLKHRGRRCFLSISKQPQRSAVGKKGAIVGGDHTWNYLYAASTGLVKPGLGWVKSYIYDSVSVSLYAEPETGAGRVAVGVFKWLKAGWAGMNMVKPKHIHEGLIRFAEPFKQLLESPTLPTPEYLAAYFHPLEEMALEELRRQARRYHRRLRTRYADHPPFNDPKLAKLFGDAAYAEGLDRVQMEAMLAKDYFKTIFGRRSLLKAPLPEGIGEASERVRSDNLHQLGVEQ